MLARLGARDVLAVPWRTAAVPLGILGACNSQSGFSDQDEWIMRLGRARIGTRVAGLRGGAARPGSAGRRAGSPRGSRPADGGVGAAEVGIPAAGLARAARADHAGQRISLDARGGLARGIAASDRQGRSPDDGADASHERTRRPDADHQPDGDSRLAARTPRTSSLDALARAVAASARVPAGGRSKRTINVESAGRVRVARGPGAGRRRSSATSCQMR